MVQAECVSRIAAQEDVAVGCEGVRGDWARTRMILEEIGIVAPRADGRSGECGGKRAIDGERHDFIAEPPARLYKDVAAAV